jgi:hypothetical protein
MAQTELERRIRNDLELALGQIRKNIQAECRILYLEATEFGELAVDVAIGENCGLQEWDYPVQDHLVTVAMIRYYIDCDLELYVSEQEEAIKAFWSGVVDELTTLFFERNPEYKIAIQS